MFRTLTKEDFEVLVPGHSISINGIPVSLSTTQFRLAVQIFSNPGITVAEIIGSVGSPEWTCRTSMTELKKRLADAGIEIEMGYFARQVPRKQNPLTQSERDGYEYRIQELEDALRKTKNGKTVNFPLKLSGMQNSVLSALYLNDICKDEALLALMPQRDCVKDRDPNTIHVQMSHLRKRMPNGAAILRRYGQGYYIPREGKEVLSKLLEGAQ